MTKINQERLIASFLELVQVDSESRNEHDMSVLLAEQLGQLGFEVHKLPVPEEISNGFNVYARLKGELPGTALFSAHMDTVTPGNGIVPVINDGVISSQGETILGGDDKSGIAAVLEAVKTVREQGQAHQSIEVAFTVHEEGGLHGSKHFDMAYIQAKEAIVLDSGGPIGTIITEAPGQQNLKVTITGRPAHAGLAPEEGVNALTVAADAIGKMRLSRIDEETTANIGVVNGGQATNIVMPELYLEAEARSLNDDKLAEQTAHMIDVFESVAAAHGARVEITSTRSYNALKVADDDALISKVKAAFAEIGVEGQTASTGGGSDANVFTAQGLKTVNLSTGMAKVHTTDEFIAVTDLVKISEFVATYISR